MDRTEKMKAIRNIFQLMLRVAMISVVCHSMSSQAAIINVSVAGLVFNPVTTNIFAGDQILWTWGGGFHSTTSSNGLWDSGAFGTPHTFTQSFPTNGFFPYFCLVHGTPTNGMRGSITVQSPPAPPTVAITNPADGAVFSEPANVTVQATAADTDGTVTNLQFLVGSIVLTNISAAPFAAAANLSAGGYTFSAVATDDAGLTATNSVGINVVTPLPLVISSPQFTTTNFQFNYAANVGLNYIIQQSTNLATSNWFTIITNTATNNPAIFMDNFATNNPAFYRVGILPNP
jgi:plastocyanin